MKLMVGWDRQDITPAQPVELMGQYYQRISRGVRDPLTATALALEQTTASGVEQAVMVSVDVVGLEYAFLKAVRAAVREQAPGLKPEMIFLNATHTHCAPALSSSFRWWVPAAQVMQPDEVRGFLLEWVVRAVVKAWNNRQPGQAGWARTYAPTGYCRRPLYTDGSSIMYGETNRADFIGLEAGNDPEVRMLFTWNERDQLTGVIANIACPAQVMEAQYVVSGDFFGELRQRLQAAHGPGVFLLPQVSAAGCQSPRNLTTQAKDEVNYWSESGMLAIADRLEKAVAEGCAAARKHIQRAPALKHLVQELELPVRRAATSEYEAACAEVKRLIKDFADESAASKELFARFVADAQAGEQRQAHGPFDNKELDFVKLENAQAVIKRYKTQDDAPKFSMELHAVRLGECAFVTNPFELYLDYGQMIQAQSAAKMTFLVQLACGDGGYLPTARAAAAGGYGSLIINGKVGPQGGRMLVEASLRAVGQLWNGERAQRTQYEPDVSAAKRQPLELATAAR